MSLIKRESDSDKPASVFEKVRKLAEAQDVIIQNFGTTSMRPAPGAKFVLVLDNSGSMADSCSSRLSKSQETQKAARQVICTHGTTVPMEVVHFGRMGGGYADILREKASPLVEVVHEGGTPMREAILEFIKDPVGSHALLISDGEPDSGPEQIIQLVKDEVVGKFVIHTVVVGIDADRNLMKMIAELTGGMFFDVPDAVKLSEAFKIISTKAVKALTDGRSHIVPMGDGHARK